MARDLRYLRVAAALRAQLRRPGASPAPAQLPAGAQSPARRPERAVSRRDGRARRSASSEGEGLIHGTGRASAGTRSRRRSPVAHGADDDRGAGRGAGRVRAPACQLRVRSRAAPCPGGARRAGPALEFSRLNLADDRPFARVTVWVPGHRSQPTCRGAPSSTSPSTSCSASRSAARRSRSAPWAHRRTTPVFSSCRSVHRCCTASGVTTDRAGRPRAPQRRGVPPARDRVRGGAPGTRPRGADRPPPDRLTDARGRRFIRWARQDSNLRLRDYEWQSEASAGLGLERLFAGNQRFLGRTPTERFGLSRRLMFTPCSHPDAP